MKKVYKYLLLIISLLLAGCNDSSYYFNYDEMIDKVVKIEVYETYGCDYRDNSSEYKKYLLTLGEDLIDDFLLDLSKIEFRKPCMICNLSFPEGISFFVSCNNSEYFIINNKTTKTQTQNN